MELSKVEAQPEPVGLVVACKKFFGLKPGQTLQDFNEELKQLTAKDKADLTMMFPSVGFTIKVPPDSVTAASK